MKQMITKANFLKVFKLLFKIILFIIAFVLLYLAFAYFLSRITIAQEANSPKHLDVYILTNGVHTDIVMPSISEHKNWFTDIDHLSASLDRTTYKYVAIGWGDKGFYLNTPSWSELKVSTALKAMVGASGTAIHATYYENMVESETCKKISISTSQYLRMVSFINESLEKNNSGKVSKIITDANKGKTDAFYEATGRYSIFYTCNSWANHVLKHSGQKACLWTAFQEGIFHKYN